MVSILERGKGARDRIWDWVEGAVGSRKRGEYGFISGSKGLEIFTLFPVRIIFLVLISFFYFCKSKVEVVRKSLGNWRFEGYINLNSAYQEERLHYILASLYTWKSIVLCSVLGRFI